MDHFQGLRDLIRSTEVKQPPMPWRHVGTIAIGGLTEVGFADDGELLLVLSHQGRGVIDCATGQKVARDRDEDRRNWYGHDRLLARGIGPLEGRLIRLTGLWGGGLPTQTKDGWHVERITLEWPNEHLLLFGSDSHLYAPRPRFTKLSVESEVRTFGFSYTGRTLVLGISSDLTIFGRA